MSELKDIAKGLCNESGCHHKCPDTDKCIVEEEAELLIKGNKSNNFDVKSNEELFKQALVEGVNNHIDKTIEEAKKIEQIEEMAETILDIVHTKHNQFSMQDLAEALYNAGYRKQSEWISVEDRLPENELERVLVTLKQGTFTNTISTTRVDTDRFVEGRWLRWGRYVSHWMPLPEAPKMKGGE